MGRGHVPIAQIVKPYLDTDDGRAAIVSEDITPPTEAYDGGIPLGHSGEGGDACCEATQLPGNPVLQSEDEGNGRGVDVHALHQAQLHI